jgi:cell division protein FtsW
LTPQVPERATPTTSPPPRDAGLAGVAPAAPDYPLIVIIATLLGLGLFMVFSASFASQGTTFFQKQIAWIALSVVACGIMAFIPFGVWRRLAIPIMFVTIVALVAVLVMGTGQFGGKRLLFGSSIQPSEFAKLAVTIYVAAWVAARGDKISGFQDGLVPFMIIMFGVTGLIILEHSISVTLIVLTIGLSIFFVGGGNLKQLAILLAIGIPCLAVTMMLSDYPLQRLNDWYAVHFNPAAISPDTLRILALLKTGGGLGTDPVFWQSKTGVPLLWTDYLFANIGKDLGLPGMVLVMALYAALAYRGLTIALNTHDRFAALAAIGVTIWISMQAAIHMGASLMLIPTTGQPLPFMSYGGSSLLATMIAVGLLLSISRSETEKKAIHAHFGFGWRDWRPHLPHFDGGQRTKDADRSVRKLDRSDDRSTSRRNATGVSERTLRSVSGRRPAQKNTDRTPPRR